MKFQPKKAITLTKRLQYSQSRTGDITSYFGMIGDAFSNKVNLLAQLIRDVHDPSLGEYKESLLRNTVRDFLPRQFEVATGFVLFPVSGLPQFNLVVPEAAQDAFTVSKQLDIIVFDSQRYPVLFRDGDFVVLRPESVLAIIEVKGTISKDHVHDALNCVYDYSDKWQKCRALYKEWQLPIGPVPALYVYGFQYYVDKNEKQDTNGAKLREQLVEFHKERFPQGVGEDIPQLHHLFVFDDVRISNTLLINNGRMQIGFLTSRGRLVRYVGGQPELTGDGTVAALLADIHALMKVGFNQFFSYIDQATRSDVLPHEHAGFDVWIDAGPFSAARSSTEEESP
jgi:hypothetical protein